MTVKEQILSLLDSHRNVYYSGESLAEMLGVTRNSIWKAVKSLQDEGYEIDAIRNKGYCMSGSNDILSAEGISRWLKPDAFPWKLDVRKTVDSTNSAAKLLAEAGAPEGTVVVSGEQTAGKGRRGRTFYSPSTTGIYFSILLRPTETVNTSVLFTTAAAVAVTDAIHVLSDKNAQIKWVNDIFLDGCKVCGILTEASVDMESGALEYVIVGLGINAFQPEAGFPNELQQSAGSIFSEPIGDLRNRMTAEVLNAFGAYYRNFSSRLFVRKYQQRSLVIGKRVLILRGEEQLPATALAVDNRCRLLVQFDDGRREALSSGEISLRLTD